MEFKPLPGDFGSSGSAFQGDWRVNSTDQARFIVAFNDPNRTMGVEAPHFLVANLQSFDFDRDGNIDCDDWAAFRLAWTEPGPVPDFDLCDALCPGDVNGDGVADSADLSVVVGNFGAVANPFDPGNLAGDVNGDGVVDAADLSVLISGFGCGSK